MQYRPGMTNFLHSEIYGINGEAFSRGRGNIATVKLMLDAGVKVIQYREKDKSGCEQYRECQAIRELTRAAGATFIVNDRVDLALAVGADGVHVGQEDLPPEVVRRLVGDTMIVGLSTNTPEHAADAAAQGIVDYIGVGPVFATATKQDAAEAVGLELVEYVAKNVPLPFVPIGGIKEGNIAEVRRRGARIVAIISDIVGAEDVLGKVRSLQTIMRQA